jgi:dTDP-4-dehydrorhamnose 3,5-epimerase-like enzyme
MPRKRKTIYNRRTGTTYSIRQRSTSAGKAGTIKGKHSKHRKKKGFWDSLFG